MSLFIPEIAIKSIIDAILLYIRDDYSTVVNKDDSYLAQLVKGIKLGKYNLYDQAVEVFINRGKGHPKELLTNLFFNSERASIPTIHIVLLEDATGANGIGVDEGFNSPIYDSISKTTKAVYNRSFDSRIHIVITSENTLEVIVVYSILRAALISTFTDLNLNGFQNLKISGGDLQINPELIPQNIFLKAIHLDFFYDVPAPSIFTNETFADLIAQGIAVNQTVQIDESSSI
jgi:hypothetical protein